MNMPFKRPCQSDAGEWMWSSYPVMTGVAARPPWLQTDWILGQFGRQQNRAREKYVDFVRAGVGLPSVWEALQGQIYLGGEEFVTRMQSALPPGKSLDEIPRVQRRPLAKPLAHYRDEFSYDLRRGMALAYLSGDYSMKAIAETFGVHYATVSRAVKAHERGE